MGKSYSFEQGSLFEDHVPSDPEVKEIHRASVLGRQFVIYGTFQNPLFLAKDVAAWLEHTNHRVMVDSVDDDEKVKLACPVNNPYGGYQVEEQWFLTENGLYEVLMLSRKPIAKQFKRQVKKILHEVREKGFYATPQAIERIIRDPGAFLKVVQALQDEKDKTKKLENNLKDACCELAKKDAVIECKDKEITTLKPKAEFTDKFLTAKDSIGISKFAQKINTALGIRCWGQKRMFAWLIAEGYMNLDHTPSQRAIAGGFMTTKSGAFQRGNHLELYHTPKVTPKGAEHFFKRIRQQKEKGSLAAYLI